MTACAADDQDFHYRFGIDLFIAGVRAMAASATTGWDAAVRGAEAQGQAAAAAARQPGG